MLDDFEWIGTIGSIRNLQELFDNSKSYFAISFDFKQTEKRFNFRWIIYSKVINFSKNLYIHIHFLGKIQKFTCSYLVK